MTAFNVTPGWAWFTVAAVCAIIVVWSALLAGSRDDDVHLRNEGDDSLADEVEAYLRELA